MNLSRARLADVPWRISTRSQSTNCVEVGPLGAGLDASVAMRDSKNRQGPVLVFSRVQWQRFVAATKDGEFDLHVMS
ncbi:DUF397 domain-containing protein [Rhizomonospora bruguierae]|uniref:DUF397 domain-containing protein n=1 Tax=Rhizomonospora bruguierae TaxID=1581705 RepID=UPI001BCEFB85|nr:DUF397 domain-containing protein [Micromonospora sp. NBRC 107566]